MILQLSVAVKTAKPSARICQLAQPKREKSLLTFFSVDSSTHAISVPITPSSRILQLACECISPPFYTVNDHLLHIQSTTAQKVTLTRVQLGLNGNLFSLFHHYLPLSAPKQVHAQHSLARPVSWPVPDHVLKAVANERLQKLARPKTRQALFEGYDPYRVSPAARAATASPRLLELSLPLPRKCKGQ